MSFVEDVSRRLEEHNEGLNKKSFTYKRRPVELKFHQEFNDVEQAIYLKRRLRDGVRRRNGL